MDTIKIQDLGYGRIATIHPDYHIFFNEEKSTILGILKVEDHFLVQAAKFFFVKYGEKTNETHLLSRLQNLGKLAEYLWSEVPSLCLNLYYTKEVPKEVVRKQFKGSAVLDQLLQEHSYYDEKARKLPQPTPQIKQNLRLLGSVSDGKVVSLWKSKLDEAQSVQERLKAIRIRLQEFSSLLQEATEKGYGVIFLWKVTTNIRPCNKNSVLATIKSAEKEIDQIWRHSIKSRAFQLGIAIEQLNNPHEISLALWCDLFSVLDPQVLRASGVNQEEFVQAIEKWINFRLFKPIERVSGHRQEASIAGFEAIASFLRNLPEEIIQEKSSISFDYEQASAKPLYLGLLAVRKNEKEFEVRKDSPVILPIDELRKHAIVLGVSGSGKSRILQIIVEGTYGHVPIIIVDPAGELTGLIKKNDNTAEFRDFRLDKPVEFPAKIYTLDDSGIRIRTNILKKPEVSDYESLRRHVVEVAEMLANLAGHLALMSPIQKTLLELWERNPVPTSEEFIEEAIKKAGDMRTAQKLYNLLKYNFLMDEYGFRVEDLLKNNLTIINLQAEPSPEVKVTVAWYILNWLWNHYFAKRPHSDELKALIVTDECHNFYSDTAPRKAAQVLEEIVRMGRSKGLGMVLATHRIQDIESILAMPLLRINLKMTTEDVLTYAQKFGSSDLARVIAKIDPNLRIGYVMFSGKEFWCKFRPTLSQPKGVESFDEISKYTAPEKVLEAFRLKVDQVKEGVPKETELSQPAPDVRPVQPVKSVYIEDQIFLKALKDLGGRVESRSILQNKLGWGTSKTIRVRDQLIQSGKIRVFESGIAKGIELVEG